MVQDWEMGADGLFRPRNPRGPIPCLATQRWHKEQCLERAGFTKSQERHLDMWKISSSHWQDCEEAVCFEDPDGQHSSKVLKGSSIHFCGHPKYFSLHAGGLKWARGIKVQGSKGSVRTFERGPFRLWRRFFATFGRQPGSRCWSRWSKKG